MNITCKEQVKVFKAFCDENRLRILEMLREGGKCACVLIDQLGIAQSSLSYHMKILCESGIVDSRQEGKWTHYKISDTGRCFAEKLLKTITSPNSAIESDDCL